MARKTEKANKAKAEEAKAAPPADDNGEIVEIDEALAILKTSRSTLYRWIREGSIHAMKAGRQWRFRRKELQRFLKGEESALPALPVSPEPLLTELRRLLAETEGPEPDPLPPDLDPLEQAIHLMLHLMVRRHASDIHVAPHAGPSEPVPVKLRIDGALHEVAQLDPRLLPHLAPRWRRLARCEVAGAQHGRIDLTLSRREFDFRACFLPTVLGDAITVRCLERSNVLLDLTQETFGVSDGDFDRVKRAIAAPNGLIAFSGPVGSGKTTVLYSAINEIVRKRTADKVMSVENPVEYFLPGVNQVQVQPAIGLTTAAALRAIARSDPDVIIIGELRSKDPEVLELCLQLCVTGHLVLTSFHANTASEAIRRLLDFGADPYMLSEGLRLISAQRLFRRLCPECARPFAPSAEDLAYARKALWEGGIDEGTLPRDFKEGAGCKECGGRNGYRGRRLVCETLARNPEIARAIRRNAPEEELERLAIAAGMTTIRADGYSRLYKGETSMTEIRRVVG